MADNTRADALRRALDTCIVADPAAVAALGDILTDDVSVWSPNLMASDLAALQDALAQRATAFTDVDIQVDALDVFANKGVAEYRVSATFSGPFVVDGDLVIEPSGQRLLLGAAVVADFEGDKIKALRNYFDDSTLLEQMLYPE